MVVTFILLQALTVVEPDDYTQQSPVISTTPVISLLQGSGEILEWLMPVTITILDQFGIILGEKWNGLKIQEFIDAFNGWTGFDVGLLDAPLLNGQIVDYVRNFLSAGTPEAALNVIAGTKPVAITSSITKPQLIRANLDNGVDKNLNGVNNRTVDFDGPTLTTTVINTK